MSMALGQPMSLEAFLAWEEQQPVRYEFDGFRPVAMTGGSANHSRVQRNLIAELTSRLRGRPCEPFGSELKILTAGKIRYPDAFVACSPVAGNATVVSDPVIVFEIISPGTSGVDRITESREYPDTPSIQRYVILEQDRRAATVFSRAHDDWAGHVIVGERSESLCHCRTFMAAWN